VRLRELLHIDPASTPPASRQMNGPGTRARLRIALRLLPLLYLMYVVCFIDRVNVSFANLRKVDFTRADLSGADLTGADVTGADFRGANLRSVRGRSQLRGAGQAKNLPPEAEAPAASGDGKR